MHNLLLKLLCSLFLGKRVLPRRRRAWRCFGKVDKHEEKYHGRDPSLPVQYVGDLVDIVTIFSGSYLDLVFHCCHQVGVSAGAIPIQVHIRLLNEVTFQFPAESEHDSKPGKPWRNLKNLDNPGEEQGGGKEAGHLCGNHHPCCPCSLTGGEPSVDEDDDHDWRC